MFQIPLVGDQANDTERSQLQNSLGGLGQFRVDLARVISDVLQKKQEQVANLILKYELSGYLSYFSAQCS